MQKTFILASLFGVGSLLSTAFAVAPLVYPKPQSANFTGQYIKVPELVVVTRGATAESAPSWEGKKSAKFDAGDLLAGVPEKSGAYRIIVKPEFAAIAAHDARGVFYAKQTLSQMLKGVDGALNAQKDPWPDKTPAQVATMGELAEGVVVDWPDIENRGTVEGFYGTPWSHEARKRQIEFYGRNKMNTYIYGPKDDKYHSAQWRLPYPEKEAAQIRELVDVAKKNHVDFVWAIHPGGSIKWTDEDMHNVIKKFELMYDMGVRSFSVFFDDIGGEGARGEKQSELLNMIQKEFVQQKKDVTRLVMCPTQYNKSWSSGSYLNDLGTTLDPSIHVMWTGNSVVHDITQEGQEWIMDQIKRPSYVWWNFPVTDYVGNHLLLGRVYGLTQEDRAKDVMSGFVSNPMDKPEASKIALFGVADYAWNIKGFDSDPSWKEGIRRLFPKCAEAVQVFADHNSDIGPSGHGYRREESVEIAPAVTRALDAVKAGKPLSAEDAAALARVYEAIARAPQAIMAATEGENPDFLRETDGWLRAFEQLGRAGLNALQSMDKGDAVRVVAAVSALDEMERQGVHIEGNGTKRNVETGTLLMTPLARAMVREQAAQLYSSLSGRPAMKPEFLVEGGSRDGAEKATDSNPGTFWHSGSYQKAGDWYGLDYGAPVPLKTVSLLMGRGDGDADYVQKGQLEASRDLVKWVPLGAPTEGRQVVWKSKTPVQARALRYRVIEPKHVNPDGSGNTVWTAIREFSVNSILPPEASSTVKNLAGVSAHQTDKLIGINRVMEVSPMKSGESLSLSFPNPVDATWLEIDLDDAELPQWLEVSLLVEGKTAPVTVKLEPYQDKKFVAKGDALPKGIKSVKAVNKGNKARDIKINVFKVDVPPVDMSHSPSRLGDGDLVTVYRCDQPLNVTVENTDEPAAREVIVVGDAEYKIKALLDNGSWMELSPSKVRARHNPADKNVGLGDEKSRAVTAYPIPTGRTIKAVRLTHDKPQEGKSLSEVIFRKG